MIVEKISEYLSNEILQAEEVWIAVALLNEKGYAFVKEKLPATAKLHYLIGIDLPTCPDTLVKIKNDLVPGKLEARIFKDDSIFHPKVYVVRTTERLVAIVGSANLTNGGLNSNFELSYKIQDQEECKKILKWFYRLYDKAYELTDENIELYKGVFDQTAESDKKNKAKRKKFKLQKPSQTDSPIDNIDFSDRFFAKEHHTAFREEIQRDRSAEANRERRKVYDRLMELHEIIFPQFNRNGLTNLDCHFRSENIVSHYYHADGYTSDRLDSMWLSYGKPRAEVRQYQKEFSGGWERTESEKDLQSFINHARLQIKLNYHKMEIWLLFGKNNNGSLLDRNHFKEQMKDQTYKQWFFKSIKGLPAEYWISINGQDKEVSSFETADEIHNFCKRDRPENYFIIGREYEIQSPEMSISQLPLTTLQEFKRLFPLYNKMRDKQFAK